jgi:hypothetical protein
VQWAHNAKGATMNRRDFFKKVAGTVGVAVLGKIASDAMSNEPLTVTIENALPPQASLVETDYIDLSDYKFFNADLLDSEHFSLFFVADETYVGDRQKQYG